MHDTAVLTRPLSYSQACDTFRAAARTARRTGCGTVSFGDDFARCSCRNRLILEHRSQHGPAGVVNGLRHPRFAQLGRADISDNDPVVSLHQLGGDLVQEILSLVGDLRRNGAGTSLLLAALVQRKLSFGAPVKSRNLDLVAVGQCGERLQPKVDADFRLDGARFGRIHLDLDVDVPPASCIGGEVPRLRLPALWNGAGHPQMVMPLEHRNLVTVQFGWTREIGKRYPIKVLFERAKAWRFRERCVTRIRKLLANRVNRIRVDTQFFGDASAEVDQIKRGRSPCTGASFPSRGGFAIDLAAVVPKEIDRARLRSERPTCRISAISDAISVGQNHMGIISKRATISYTIEAANGR